MATVSITRLRVRAWRWLPMFALSALRAALQARAARGSLAVSLLADRGHVFWTRTVWSDEASMNAYMMAGFHRRVMPRLLEWCDEAALVSWSQDGGELPEWTEVHRRLQESGRTSKVNHPSAAHRAFRILPPATLRAALRLK